MHLACGDLDKDFHSEVLDEITVFRVGIITALITVIRLTQSGISSASGLDVSHK